MTAAMSVDPIASPSRPSVRFTRVRRADEHDHDERDVEKSEVQRASVLKNGNVSDGRVVVVDAPAGSAMARPASQRDAELHRELFSRASDPRFCFLASLR